MITKEYLENLPNPYPEDIFPKLELSGEQTRRLNNFCIDVLGCTLDKFSAELMRRGRNNLIKEFKINFIEELEMNKENEN